MHATNVGTIVYAIPSSDSVYSITSSKRAFIGLITDVKLELQDAQGEDSRMFIRVVPLFSDHKGLLDLALREKEQFGQDGNSSLGPVTLLLQKIITNKPIEPKDFRGHIYEIYDYEVAPTHFHVFTNTSLPVLEAKILSILEYQEPFMESTPHLFENTKIHAEEFLSFAKELKQLTLKSFDRPHLSL